MTEKKLKVTFEIKRFKDKCPRINVVFNKKATEIICDRDTASFESILNLGWNRFNVELVNKESKDTVLDSAGNIIDDLYVIIKEFKVDDFDVTRFVLPKGRYIKKTKEPVLGTNGFMGFTGTYSFKLFYPTNLFIRNLEIKQRSSNDC
jgi:hypothetical protein